MGRTGSLLLLLVMAFVSLLGPVRVKGIPERVFDFFVLRSDRVTVWVSTGQSENLSCSIIGTGYTAQMDCRSYSTAHAIPLVYNTALLVGSDGVGYIVKCGGGLLRRIGCHPLTAGTVLSGIATGGKISISEGGKTTNYRIVTSAFVGKLPQQASPEPIPEPKAPSRPQVASDGPRVQQAIHSEPSERPSEGTGGLEDQGREVKDQGDVMLMSEPKGAEIYVDGKFMGSTPSVVSLSPGSHEVLINSKGYKPWTRKLEVTKHSKVTIQAVLEQ